MHRNLRRGRPGDRGFGMMELMVTMAITLVILAGAFKAFDDARKTAEVGSLIADDNQNLRAGVSQMTRDLIQTGRDLPNGGIPIPFGAGAVPIRRPSPPGLNLTFPAAWEVMPSICPGSALGPVVSGVQTDLVTMVYADTTLALNEWPLAALDADGGRMRVDARTPIGDPRSGIQPGDLIFFSNGFGNAIQTVTSVQGQDVFFAQDDPIDGFGFNQRTAAEGTIIQIRGGATFPPTSATRVLMVSFYLDTATAPGQLRLVRRVNFQPARMIAVGIDNLQLSYDIVDGTTNPTNQPDALAPNTPAQIRKVNLFASARSDLQFTLTRQPVRTGVATQVSLRSMSFVDRYR